MSENWTEAGLCPKPLPYPFYVDIVTKRYFDGVDNKNLTQVLNCFTEDAILTEVTSNTVHVGRDGGHAVLVVEDSGPGIPAEERERVLQRFVRGLGAGGMAGGSGLGLAIVQTIAQRFGAKLLLDESPNLGGLRIRVLWLKPDQAQTASATRQKE